MKYQTIKIKPNEKGEYFIKLYGTSYKLELEPVENKPKQSK